MKKLISSIENGERVNVLVDMTPIEESELAAEQAASMTLYKDLIVDALDIVFMMIAFDHENRMRVLEGRQSVTKAQFKAAIRSALDTLS